MWTLSSWLINLAFASSGVNIAPSEIKDRLTATRVFLSPIHGFLQDVAHHSENSLNVTGSDYAVHRVPLIKSADQPLSLLRGAVRQPVTFQFPIRVVINDTVFGSKEPIPTMVPGQKGPIPLPETPLRPLRSYCEYNQCTTAGNISKNLGKSLTRLYESSVPIVALERAQANMNAFEYAARRQITPSALSSISESPLLNLTDALISDVGLKFLPSQNGTLHQLIDSAGRVGIWNNLMIIDPPDQRRRAHLMARQEARDALICRLANNLLPHCQGNAVGDIGNAPESVRVLYQEGSPVNMLKLSGIYKSCLVQGGCLNSMKVAPSDFEGVYLFQGDSEYVKRDSRMDFHLLDRELEVDKFGWLLRGNISLKAAVVPRYPDVGRALSEGLPILYLKKSGGVDQDEVWGKAWLDWRLGQLAKNLNECKVGIFDWEEKLCWVPVAVSVDPVSKLED